VVSPVRVRVSPLRKPRQRRGFRVSEWAFRRGFDAPKSS
jgi:hypothetical protein